MIGRGWSGSSPGAAEGGHMRRLVLGAMALLFAAAAVPAMAQDPVKVDPKHYKVEFENDEVRILRVTYGAHEKSVMHEHPNAVAVFLADGQSRFTLPDGKTQDNPIKAGTSMWTPAGKHLPENLGDKPFELILVETKAKPAAK
jgi:quercetin dioxygenase-like cupin family protein